MTHERERERDTDPCAPPPAVLYTSILEELEEARRAAGGTLSQSSEAAFVERLDELWWKLSADEQDALDAQGRAPSE